MGKGPKGKGKPQQKQNSKFKQRSAQNQKQLAKVEEILKGRSNSKDAKKQGSRHNKLKNNNKEKDVRHQSKNKGQRFEKDNRSSSKSNKRQNNGQTRFEKNTNPKKYQQQKGPNKTKQIKKSENNKFNKNKPQQGIKGNTLFKIIPQSMNGDAFAALGGDSQQQQHYGQQDIQLQGEDNEQLEGQQQLEQDDENLQDQDDQNQGQQLQDEGQQQLDQEQQMDEQVDNQQQDELQQEDEQIDGQQQVDEQNGNQVQKGQEQQINNQQQENFEIQQDKQPVDISVISLKIQQTIQILMNVQRLGGGKSRKHFLQELKQLVHQYYGYNFQLISHFLDFLNPAEMIQFFEANETQRPLTIRTNTLKTRRKQLAQSLIQRGVNLDPLAEWSKVGIKIYDTKVPIGATPEYLAGHYMLQSASSLLPVIALDPQVGEKILDMASAPGGKTTYIAQMMKNTGCIFANDLKKERLRALQFNLYRLGVTNTAVTCRDGRKFATIFPGTFDRVLLDAPCTGLGIISKDHSIKANRLMIDIYKNSHLQKELLLAAIDSCKVNGVVVYSTCSVSPLQNEEVVNYALKRRFIKIVDCGVEVGEEGLTKFVQKRFHVDLKKTRRIYPHVHNMDGFYVAKIVKVAKGKKQEKQDEIVQKQDVNNKYPQEEVQEQEVIDI